jgi:trans-aconitate 2-methyltransferase
MPDTEPRTVVDLGCGTGNLTAVLAERWPDARVEGIDSSGEMIERARSDHPGIEWSETDINLWEPGGSIDAIFSNATLHWLDDHASVFPRLVTYLSDGGVLAVQMPDNWAAPTHRIPAAVLDSGDWPENASAALMRDRLSSAESYAEWLQPATVDMWRTTYYQQLTGEDPVWTWVTGSVLRPVLAALVDEDRERFASECKARYLAAYPTTSAGVTTLAFSRLFMVAVKLPTG